MPIDQIIIYFWQSSTFYKPTSATHIHHDENGMLFVFDGIPHT
jgi:hypothetical protein